MGDDIKILVVDDTPTNLEVITDILFSQGYIVATVTTGAQALRWLNDNVATIILLDIQMPGMSGFEICQKIKANPKTATIPVIFITARSDIESIAQAFSLGAVDYISKPFQEPELLARVRTHLKLQQINQALEHQVAERTVALEHTMTQLQNALAQLKASQLQLIQQEKMSALGNLVAGIAHEVNNPVGFLQGNIQELKQGVTDVLAHLKLYQHLTSHQDIADHAKVIDLDFLLADIPKMLASMETGCDRINKISTSLRTFSRSDKAVKTAFNLHEGLESTLLILKYRLKAQRSRPAIQVIRQYGELPEICCFPGQLNQVFMNILANAIDALDEASQNTSYQALEAHPQQITVRTNLDNHRIKIVITDNGVGISDKIKAQIFEPSFTTKEVGKGTGLGLSIARQIVVDLHGGTLEVTSQAGQGAEFCIQLPIESNTKSEFSNPD